MFAARPVRLILTILSAAAALCALALPPHARLSPMPRLRRLVFDDPFPTTRL